MKKNFLCILLIFSATLLFAQPAQRPVKVELIPQHSDWVYALNEPVIFNVRVTQNNICLKNISVSYEYGQEKMPAKTQKELLKNGEGSISIGTLSEPGFLRCRAMVTVDGVKYDGFATAGIAPLEIVPTASLPDDFMTFWNKAMDENRQLNLDFRKEYVAERSTETVDVYHVSYQNYRPGSRMYGWLAIPKEKGSYPAILRLPGAGVWKSGPDISTASRGAIVLSIGIHGIPLTYDNDVYVKLNQTALSGYARLGAEDADRNYYKRVYLGCVRGIDALYALSEFDGKNLAVFGNSQGGALSLVTAGLDKRVTACAAIHPALCDLTGYLYGRAGGWPHFYQGLDKNSAVAQLYQKSLCYYDVVNFARQLSAPVYFTWGYNDWTCPPTSMYSAANVIRSSKTFDIVPETNHWFYPEQLDRLVSWLFTQFH